MLLARVTRSSILLQGYASYDSLRSVCVPFVRECAWRTRISVMTSQSSVPKKCRTSTFQKSFFIRTTRIWNLLITRLDLDNFTFENFKSVLYGYYSWALAINYDPDSPRSFKSICLKCNTARFLDQEISCCMWFKLLLLYLFIFWVHSNWLSLLRCLCPNILVIISVLLRSYY